MMTGVFALLVLFFLGKSFSYQIPAVVLGIPLLWILGVWLGGFLGRRIKFFTQFGKFAAVGFSSASIDFAILNFLSSVTGVTAGVTVGWINIPGFLVAVVNGYLWNKLWVFGKPSNEGVFKDFPKFFGVTSIGLLINSIVLILITGVATLNIAKVIANAFAMIWNFAGYKFFAFRNGEK